VTADGDQHAEDWALVARANRYVGHVEDMPAAELVFLLGALVGALSRHLTPAPATLMRPGRTLVRTTGLCTVYRVAGGTELDHECAGVMASPALAVAVCDAVNAAGVPLPPVSVNGKQAP
jgi:hypothetical protein